MDLYCSKFSMNFHYYGVGIIVHTGEFLGLLGER